jgi:hypothetical protein
MKSSTTFVYNFCPDSEVMLTGNRKYKNYPDFETEQKHPRVNVVCQVELIRISSSLYHWKA